MRKRLLRIVSVEPVIHGVLKIVVELTDIEGVVDVRPINRARQDLHAPARSQKPSRRSKLEEHGHSIYWVNERG